MRPALVKVLLAAGLALGLAIVPRGAAAQRALVYCPVNLDRAGCDTVVAVLAGGSAYPGGVDRGYDGTGGTVDLRSADLFAYSVFVVPSLADDSTSQPYALLRDSLVVEHLRAALIGGIAAWSGSPDQGTTNRAEKDQLIQNLAHWAGASYAAAHGPGLVALLDLSQNANARYDWLRAITPAQLTSDLEVVAYDSVRALTPTATAILAAGNGALAYASMAALGLATPTATAGLSLDAVGATGTTKGGQVVLATLPAGNTSTAAIATDKHDYAPGTTVIMSGHGWAPGEPVTIELVEDPMLDTHLPLTAVADSSGNWTNAQFSPDVYDVSVRFIVTATGGTSGMRAQTTFTDASPAADGEGQMTVSPSVVVQGADTTLTFNFMAGQGSFSNNSTVKIAVPSAWPAPQNTSSGSAGYVQISGSSGCGTVSITSVANRVITVTQACGNNKTFSLTYGRVTPPAAGAYTFTTSTHNSANGGSGTSIAVQPVVTVKISTSTALTSGSNPSTYGDAVTFTASVTPVTGPTGSVSFYDGGSCSSPGATLASAATLSGGTASTPPISTLSLGSHSVVACYGGDATYLSSSRTVPPTVNPLPAPDRFGTMGVSPTSVIAGQTGRTLTFTFAVPSNYAFSANSKVNVVVPSVWTTPQIATPSGAAYVR